MNIRQAGTADVHGLVETLTLAFLEDPVWGWAFPERDALESWWQLFVPSALRYPCTWIAGDFEAVVVWLPPDGVELTDQEEATVEPLLEKLLGARAPAVSKLAGLFDSTHPDEPPHYYLSLLGTHPEHREQGLGMALLEHGLSQVDREGMPAYLESSNPGNNPRYEARGFRQVGSFERPDGKHEIARMWREPA